MSIEKQITEIINSIDDISYHLNPNNDYGQTVGDELHSISWQLERIADILERLETKFK
jgi:hypothetical protein